MPRRIPGDPPGSEIAYVPASFGNRADPHPVVVYLKLPTRGERHASMMALSGSLAFDVGANGAKLAKSSTGVQTTLAELGARHRKAVESWVIRVENYSDGLGPITTGPELWSRGEEGIINEVHAAVERLLLAAPEPAPTASPDTAVVQH